MSAPKLTPWFPWHIKPVRRGVYAAQLTTWKGDVFEKSFAYWDGKRWGNNQDTTKSADKHRSASSVQKKPWRGLAEQPK